MKDIHIFTIPRLLQDVFVGRTYSKFPPWHFHVTSSRSVITVDPELFYFFISRKVGINLKLQ